MADNPRPAEIIVHDPSAGRIEYTRTVGGHRRYRESDTRTLLNELRGHRSYREPEACTSFIPVEAVAA